MSVVSSYFSSRSSALGLNAQLASLMDSVFAIALGLAVRFVIDLVSHHDLKVTGTLVGLWEGVVMHHFLRKMPASFDPYVAYGVRLFVDFLFTESLARLVLVILWTGMGIVLADVAPALWIDAGLRRIWRRFRRDLYIILHSIPFPLFTRSRIVRFSPTHSPSNVASAPPSVATPRPSTSYLAPPTPAPARPSRRPVPGAFPGEISETETDVASVSGRSTSTLGTHHFRFATFPGRSVFINTETESSLDSHDPDEANISSSASSYSTGTLDPSIANPSEIPDEEEAQVAQKADAKGKGREESDHETTPKQEAHMLPTPSDSFATRAPPQDEHGDGVKPPPITEVPNIPDQAEDNDWEKVDKNDALLSGSAVAAGLRDLPPLPAQKDAASHENGEPISPPAQPVPTGSGQVQGDAANFEGTSQPPASVFSPDKNTAHVPEQSNAPPPYQSIDIGAGNLLNLDDDFYEDPNATVQQPQAMSTPLASLSLDHNATSQPSQPSGPERLGPDNQLGLVDHPDSTAQGGDAQEHSSQPSTLGAHQSTQDNQQPAQDEQQPEQPSSNAEPLAGAGAEAEHAPFSPASAVPSELPSELSERVKQLIAYRNESAELRKELDSLEWQGVADGGEVPAENAKQIEELKKKKGKMERRIRRKFDVDDGEAAAPTKVDLKSSTVDQISPILEDALYAALRPGQDVDTLTIQFTTTASKKKQRSRVTQVLKDLGLSFEAIAGELVVKLPLP